MSKFAYIDPSKGMCPPAVVAWLHDAEIAQKSGRVQECMHGYFLEVKAAFMTGMLKTVARPVSLGLGSDRNDHAWMSATLIALADHVTGWYDAFWVVEKDRGPAIVTVVGQGNIRVTYLRPQERPEVFQSEWLPLLDPDAKTDTGQKRVLIEWTGALFRSEVVRK